MMEMDLVFNLRLDRFLMKIVCSQGAFYCATSVGKWAPLVSLRHAAVCGHILFPCLRQPGHTMLEKNFGL